MITDEIRQSYIREIIDLLNRDFDIEVGVIPAEAILDLVLQTAGKEVFNKGVEEASKILKIKFADLEVDLEMIRQK